VERTKKLDLNLPHDEISERAILGALLVDPRPEYLVRVIEFLNKEDFFLPAHRLIFEAISALYNGQSGIDLNTVSSWLSSHRRLKSAGGMAYLSELTDQVPEKINFEDYLQNVKQKSLLRNIIAVAQDMLAKSQEVQAEPDILLDHVEKELLHLKKETDRGGFIELATFIPEAMNYVNQIQKEGLTAGIKTGFIELDSITSGFHRGDLIIIAARPSMGKTAIGLNIAYNQAVKEKKRVAFFSIEMPKIQIVLRLLAMATRINMQALRTGRPRLTAQEWAKLEQEAVRLQKSQIYIDDSASLTILDIKTRAQKLKYQLGGIDVVFVDYLQLVKVGRKRDRVIDSRSTEVGEVSAGLKELAKELDIPVVALTQLNRGPEWRKGKKEKEVKYLLSDLRESGNIEQDADVVIFLHREEQIDPDTSRKGIAELIIAKQRNGPTGRIQLAYQQPYTRFENLETRVGDDGSYLSN